MVVDMATGFGVRLAELRKAKGLSQNELAKKAGLNRQSVARWESEENVPSWDAVLALAAALGVKPNAFMPKAE